MRTPRWKWLRRILLAAGVAVLASLATGWLMFQHIPSWYQPPAIAPDDQRVKNDLFGKLNEWEGKLHDEKQAFEFTLTQDQINAWLAIRETIESLWPASKDWLPAALSDPFVCIERDALRLAATYRRGGIRTVVSIRLRVTAGGDVVGVQLVDVAGGSLSMPKSWIENHLAELDRRFWPAGQRSRYQLGGPPLPRLTGLLEGAQFPNAWVSAHSGQPFRITRVRCEPGALTVTVEPLPR